MDCPKCNKPMRKVRWEITSNGKIGKDFKEYEKSTYECKSDFTWVITEPPMAESPKSEPSK